MCERRMAHTLIPSQFLSGHIRELGGVSLLCLDPYQSLTVTVCGIVQTGAVLMQKQNYRALRAFMPSIIMLSTLGYLQGFHVKCNNVNLGASRVRQNLRLQDYRR